MVRGWIMPTNIFLLKFLNDTQLVVSKIPLPYKKEPELFGGIATSRSRVGHIKKMILGHLIVPQNREAIEA